MNNLIHTVDLGLAERQLLTNLLSTGRKGDLASARMARSVRQAFNLREARMDIEELSDDIQREFQYWKQGFEKAMAEGRKFDEKRPPSLLDWGYLLEKNGDTVKTYTCENSVLVAIKDQLVVHDWAKVTGPEGEEKTVTVEQEMLEVLADLVDELDRAIS
ncbi:MAG: hypothetical protein M0R06_26075 [Sphaerochaeta sp.]|jgi:hypothetical protein|nr:hypothetical protein [Sphaerochaeta sp.]